MNKPLDEKALAMRRAVTLADCPIGLFAKDGELCLKTEYGNNEGRIDAYIVSSGEFFWGGTSQPKDQRRVMVNPVVIEATQAGESEAVAAPAEVAEPIGYIQIIRMEFGQTSVKFKKEKEELSKPGEDFSEEYQYDVFPVYLPSPDIAKLQEDNERLREDAERWRSLMASERIRFIGSAGFDHGKEGQVSVDEKRDGWLHFGIEVWDVYPGFDETSNPAYRTGKNLVIAYADDIRARATLAGQGKQG